MFIRIGIGKFLMDFGDRRKGRDRRERHFIMDDEDRKAAEERRKSLERRIPEPFPENDSVHKGHNGHKGPDSPAPTAQEQVNLANLVNQANQAGLEPRGKKEQTPRKWRK